MQEEPFPPNSPLLAVFKQWSQASGDVDSASAGRTSTDGNTDKTEARRACFAAS